MLHELHVRNLKQLSREVTCPYFARRGGLAFALQGCSGVAHEGKFAGSNSLSIGLVPIANLPSEVELSNGRDGRSRRVVS